MFKYFSVILILINFTGCDKKTIDGLIIHSLEASKQKVYFHEEKKILITDDVIATKVLTNPISFDKPLIIALGAIEPSKLDMSQIKVVSKNSHISISHAPIEQQPKVYKSDNIDKALQSVGCAPSKNNQNIDYNNLPNLAKKVSTTQYNDTNVIVLHVKKFEDETTPFLIEIPYNGEIYKIRYLLRKMELDNR